MSGDIEKSECIAKERGEATHITPAKEVSRKILEIF
jgi:hypothetical protein